MLENDIYINFKLFSTVLEHLICLKKSDKIKKKSRAL